MKHTILLFLFTISTSAFADTLAICESPATDQAITVKQIPYSGSNWKSITIEWNRANNRTSIRQFINGEIKRNNAKTLILSQRNMFLGMGDKTKFVLDKENLTAKLSGKVGAGGIVIGDGPNPGQEPARKFKIEFDHCEIFE